MTLRFRHWWPPLVMVLFLITVASAFAALPSGFSDWWGLVVFLLLALPFGLVANLWGPMLFYRFRVRRRPRWAESDGYVTLPLVQLPNEVGEVFSLFRRPEKGIVLAAFRGPRSAVIDYSYLRRYAGDRPQEGGVEARDAATVVVAEFVRQHPRLDIEPRPFGFGIMRGALEKRLGAMDLAHILPSSVETGDPAFDGAFLVTAADGRSARRLLGEPVRRTLLRHPALRLHVRGSHGFLHLGELLTNDELRHLLALAAALATELDASPREGLSDRASAPPAQARR